MRGWADISEDGKYRYFLGREWGMPIMPRLAFVMLNPSTADATENDPTIRRCIAFAQREGFSGIGVGNLFGFRATDPKHLRTAVDPIGPKNDEYLARLIGESGLVVCAWGSDPMTRKRGADVKRLLKHHGAETLCLAINADGNPKHPLYVKGDATLKPY